MLKIFTGLVSAAFILASPALAEEAQHRQLGPHVHGQGTLDIAIEGKKIQMELVVPGMDIVGFEHVASTDEQKAAVEKAKAKLTDVLSVFKLPAAAQCKAEAANVESRKEVHHEGDEDHDEDEKDGPRRSIPSSTPRTRSVAKRRKMSPASRPFTSRTSQALSC